jgi:hypothetical protein
MSGAVEGPVTAEYAAWLREFAQAVIKHGEVPRLERLAAGEDPGQVFSSALAEVRSLLGRQS